MIPLLTREAVRELDRDAIDRLGVPGLTLMERAGQGAFDLMVAHFPNALGRVVVVCGPGQNGGDGFVVARLLMEAGHPTHVLLCAPGSGFSGDAKPNLERLKDMGADLTSLGDGDWTQLLESASLFVDALFGTGLTRPVEGQHASLVTAINNGKAPTVSLDLPSGVDANTGAVLGCAIQAQLTPTFGALKAGLFQYPGTQLAGHVSLVSIGVQEPTEAPANLIEAADVARWLPVRVGDTHKGRAGHVLVVAGSPGRTGAALLAGLGAQRTGAGLVTLVPRGAARQALDAKVVEMMTEALPDDADAAMEALGRLSTNMGAAVVGPGLGLDGTAKHLCQRAAVELAIPAVLDADALTNLANGAGLKSLREARASRVLTPHPGEAARLLSTDSASVQANRYVTARKLAETSQCVVVLKGAGTVVADPSGRVAVCDRGTPALASAGTGDVLAGAIGALLIEQEPFAAACAGVYLHAVAGELGAESDRGLLAREVADALPAALEACRLAHDDQEMI